MRYDRARGCSPLRAGVVPTASVVFSRLGVDAVGLAVGNASVRPMVLDRCLRSVVLRVKTSGLLSGSLMAELGKTHVDLSQSPGRIRAPSRRSRYSACRRASLTIRGEW